MKKNIQTQGKRKRAVARATLAAGTGKIIINGQLLENYADAATRLRISEPLVLAGDILQNLNFDIVTAGGGMTGQADAIRLAMARALVQHDKKLKKVFDEYDRLLLVADVRRKEVRKPNDSKARRRSKKST
ncbi:30S ribosomal protein S9 [Candidatus Woesearchaeota archaeon]|nr:30S ribosomal protein S9 [Candidatus Woesearchaeota archaeon]